MSVIFTNQKKRKVPAGGFFHLEDEKTKTRVSGYGQGDNIRLIDEYGNIWRGTAERADDDSVVYRFRDGRGKSLSGIGSGELVTLRDEHGNTWKGFIG